MTKFIRVLLWIGFALVAALIAMRLLIPELLLRNDPVWFTLSFGAAISLSFAAAEFCGLSFSVRSLERLPIVFSAMGIALVLDKVLGVGHFSGLWRDRSATPLLAIWFGGVIAYHLFKYRSRARANGP